MSKASIPLTRAEGGPCTWVPRAERQLDVPPWAVSAADVKGAKKGVRIKDKPETQEDLGVEG